MGVSLAEEDAAAGGCCLLIVIIVVVIIIWKIINRPVSNREMRKWMKSVDRNTQMTAHGVHRNQPPPPQYYQQNYYQAPPPTQVREREVTREVVKIRCQYCGALYDERANSCPKCGGR